MQRGEEIRVTSETGGEKGKKLAQVSSLDPKALLVLAEVSGWGATKYSAHNFLRGYLWSLSFDAAMRHLLKFWGGEELDPESGLPHLGHAAWHCLAMISFLERGIGTDDRFDSSAKVAHRPQGV
ncbi:dATP/dGTP diphosphohydrolase domain-containing protein [Lentzea sp. JNUCC 0626]|uniref:dATP/dGTP diphosphohydrolase domain-containing protein n=1 Tax=Lentzea sp. JNUCC 0626 TaxID=3367513 RepID=UPI003747CB49